MSRPRRPRPNRTAARRPSSRAGARPGARRPTDRSGTGSGSAPTRGPAARTHRPDPRAAPTGSSLRRRVERWSVRPLLALSAAPAFAPAVLLAGLVVAGAAVDGLTGGLLLLLPALFLGWLTYLSWPAVPWRGRAVRIVSLVVVGGLAAWKLAGGDV